MAAAVLARYTYTYYAVRRIPTPIPTPTTPNPPCTHPFPATRIVWASPTRGLPIKPTTILCIDDGPVTTCVKPTPTTVEDLDHGHYYGSSPRLALYYLQPTRGVDRRVYYASYGRFPLLTTFTLLRLPTDA
ncbi:hypothetical protein BU23DRAFT_630997 [Bimuria novae-zelandiae CBS 107.79]|uniref:Uncharacterized protein n=1 Tax=Bimuria novae-zelandiae CBS 107.79 TaxID=1447943 RepID=A0A6A5UJM2_9PLEO|nr:hypothetical protein BU23DRAFT_630997 [Bimuria novae-zelandiae CBS 107.79]